MRGWLALRRLNQQTPCHVLSRDFLSPWEMINVVVMKTMIKDETKIVRLTSQGFAYARYKSFILKVSLVLYTFPKFEWIWAKPLWLGSRLKRASYAHRTIMGYKGPSDCPITPLRWEKTSYRRISSVADSPCIFLCRYASSSKRKQEGLLGRIWKIKWQGQLDGIQTVPPFCISILHFYFVFLFWIFWCTVFLHRQKSTSDVFLLHQQNSTTQSWFKCCHSISLQPVHWFDIMICAILFFEMIVFLNEIEPLAVCSNMFYIHGYSAWVGIC